MAPIFEAAYWRRAAGNPHIKDALFGLMAALEKNPRVIGKRHEGFSGADLWYYESPRLIRVPRFYVLYEIDDAKGVVTLWSFCLV